MRRDFPESAIHTYLQAVEAFRQRAGKRLDHLGPGDMRHYQVYLLEERKLPDAPDGSSGERIFG